MGNNTKIFGNPVSPGAQRKADAQRKKFAKKFGFNPDADYRLSAVPDETLYKPLGIKNLVMGDKGRPVEAGRNIIVGTIRMGYGHYRIGMAAASAAKSMGLTPLWLDLMSYTETTGGKIINHLNQLYSLGSRLSQKSKLFDRLYWEPLTAETFKKLSYNASDREMCRLMAPIYKNIPSDLPVAAAHAWPALAALHGGMERVVNMIPDNWPLGLHLAEGSVHSVQTPSAYLGYMTLKNMGRKGEPLNPMPATDIENTGHYVDHELVSNIERDCEARIRRANMDATVRILLPIGGAGAQKELAALIIKQIAPLIKNGKVTLFVNAGDHTSVADFLKDRFKENNIQFNYHTDWSEITEFSKRHITGQVEGAHLFYSENIFSAVYSTNLLMRCSDFMITKPSELSFYPVPKLMIQRVGGHEAMGAIRSSEIGDGTIECENPGFALQMLDLMIKEKNIIKMMCENIMKNKKAGIYNGAYNVIKLAMRKN